MIAAETFFGWLDWLLVFLAVAAGMWVGKHLP